jgi:transposase InsO family protein
LAAAKNKEKHPFERLLPKMTVKHRYTVPSRPQTDGKVDRFRRTLKEDFIKDALHGNIDDLKNELSGFWVCYNEHGPLSAIGNIPSANRLNM